MAITFTVNGASRTVDVPPLTRLIDVLRETLRLTGTKEGCGEGECGSCTVLVDRQPVNACLMPIGQCDGREITTVEGIVDLNSPSELAQAFVGLGAVQCGICTPGMVVSAYSLLSRVVDPTDDQIRDAMAGNICRCTGYERIIEAVRKAAKAMGSPKNEQQP